MPILKGDLKVWLRLISLLIKSRVVWGSLQWKVKWGWDSSLSLNLGHKVVGEFPILCIAGHKGREK